MSRTSNTTTVGTVGLQNPDSASGSSVTNAQREFNSLSAFLGNTLNSAFDATPPWTDSTTDTVFTKVDAINEEYRVENKFFAEIQRVAELDGSYGGATDDITALMGSRVPGGTASSVGVVTDPTLSQFGIVRIRSLGIPITDNGAEIYGRLEYDDTTDPMNPAWIITYYSLDPTDGSEVATDLPTTTDIEFYFLEVFTAETRPTLTEKTGSIIPFGGVGSGGAGSGFYNMTVIEGPLAPVRLVDQGFIEWEFDQLDSKSLFLSVAAPSGYVTETPLKLVFVVSTPPTTGAYVFEADVSVYQPSQDARGTPRLQEAFTVTQTVDAGDGANTYTTVEVNITDTDGIVDFDAILPGDVIRIELSRLPGDAGDTVDDVVRLVEGTLRIENQ
jgi:hypothetical protein